MIVVTGAAGFIGSALLSGLMQRGYGELVGVDDFDSPIPGASLGHLHLYQKVSRDSFFDWLSANGEKVQCILHLGARTNTAEFDKNLLHQMNTDYSRKVWEACCRFSIPLLYASSAATYGAGEHGFDDNETQLNQLHPLNPYGWSKHEFDLWVHEQTEKPPFWAGFKFFNVFGPNEWHKGRMASVVLHSFEQIQKEGTVKLFRSHKPEYEDGGQLRDFIYVKDVLNVLIWFMENRKYSGLYNLGTGKARTFYDLAVSVFSAMGKTPSVTYIDIPEDIRDKYQYYTQANMQKIRDAGYPFPFMELEDSVSDYVQNHLIPNQVY